MNKIKMWHTNDSLDININKYNKEVYKNVQHAEPSTTMQK